MTLSTRFVILLLLLTLGSFSQSTFIFGKVLSEDDGEPIPFVNIRESGSGKRLNTDEKGEFKISLSGKKAVFRFTTVGYDTTYYSVSLLKDTIRFTIKMKYRVSIFNPVDIFASRPDTVIGSQKFFIEDFEFYGDQFILLTFEKKPEKSKVMLASEEQKVISVFDVPVNAQELYKDFLGNVNVIGKDSVYRVLVENEKVRLVALPPDDFENMIKPCIDTINGKIVFSDYREDYPEFNYYTWDRDDSSATKFKNVIDEDLSLMYSFEYDYLKPRQKVYARKVEMATGIDKREIAAYMTNFAQSRYFTPLYAPLFVIRDTMYLFEHYKNQLYKLNKDGKLLDSVPINYHKPLKWREWRRKLIREERSDRIFGLFQKDGYYFLKEIDKSKGQVMATNKLHFPYVGKIRVKDGYAYYIYRPFESLQTKYLYKELLKPVQ